MPQQPHAFVAMPFGAKPGPDGHPIDFNRVYAELIAPALVDAGLSAFRADQEMRAGDIRSDMFQELLIADLVVADLTIDNPNVWYELGVRHALRARGVVLISGGRTPTAFDLFTDRKLRYSIARTGPDPATLADDVRRLSDMVRRTMESWHGRKLSPVYSLMPNLQEPDWKALRIGDVQEFWERHDRWESRIELARRAGRVADILTLADEAPVAAFRAQDWAKAGEALRRLEHFRFALEQLDKALAIEPRNLRALLEKGLCLERLGLAGAPGHSLDRARAHYRDILRSYPDDPEALARLGRMDKDAWVATWRRDGHSPEQQREDAADEIELLDAAIDSYARAYRAHPGCYHAGINALTLMHVARHLTGDPRRDREMSLMAAAVRFAAESATDPAGVFWSKGTLADLEVLTGTSERVRTAYRSAIAADANDRFALGSIRAQLSLLLDLGFQPGNARVGIETIDRALARLSPPGAQGKPRKVFLFSGHRVDAPGREPPRFPADKEPIVAREIAAALDRLDAGAGDLALCQAAAGGDLLFLEACQQRGVRCEVLLPFDEPEFIAQSVLPSSAGAQWRERFHAMKERLPGPAAMRVMPEELGPLPEGSDAYKRCNLWLLYSALAHGVDKVRFVAFWNGEGGDGPGGTAHLCSEVAKRTGQVIWIDPRTLW